MTHCSGFLGTKPTAETWRRQQSRSGGIVGLTGGDYTAGLLTGAIALVSSPIQRYPGVSDLPRGKRLLGNERLRSAPPKLAKLAELEWTGLEK